MGFLIEDLLESIKLRSFAPISQATLDDDDLISLSNEELSLNLTSDLVSVREDFFTTSEDTSIRANVSYYPIPSRAIGNALKKVFYVDSNSNLIALNLIDSSRRDEFALTAAQPQAYYFEGDEIVLCPKPTQALGSIRFVFPGKPNQLIATSSCAKITAISQGASTVTFTVNTDLTASLTTSSYVDIVSAKSPFKLWTYRALISSISSTTIELALTAVQDEAQASIEPQVGDYICPTGFTNIPQIPTEWHPVLSQMVNVRLMGSLGDLNKKASEQAELERLRENALKLVRNRVEASLKKISKKNSLITYL
jgi:hypothetical protein